jgi:DNA-binding beta-propeller fold protein YncE
MSQPKSSAYLVLGLALVVAAAVPWVLGRSGRGGPAQPSARPVALTQAAGDPLDGGAAWLNTAGPITLRELRGKVVLLDFWTYCCINCHHVLRDLAKLEEKYRDALVVIGVHTPKFSAEQDTENIRHKVREYRIRHPVVSDANMTLWNRFGVQSWPTLVLIDPEGNILGSASGEGNYEVLDRVIGETVRKAKAAGKLDETPVKFFPENEKLDSTPLLFPGKVLADAASNRLFIADTGHNRIVVSGLDGKNPTAIGSGAAGLTDGPFEKAGFNRPQGMVLVDDTLYVADTENHAIRAVDLRAKGVTTVAGDGTQARRDPRLRFSGPARDSALNSPWDLARVPGSKVLYIAMAGPHQIWRLDLASATVGVFAGTGREHIGDGPADRASFAQPSGIATDGAHLYVADSEGSCVRSIALTGTHAVSTLIGEHDLPNVLFSFDDKDGKGTAARLQHCLGLTLGDGKVYIADTYNNKVKVCDPKTRTVRTLLGDAKPGETDNPPRFYQPGGLSLAGSKLYVADTNNGKVRVIDLAAQTVSTLTLEKLGPPTPPARRPAFPNAVKATLARATVAPGSELVVDVTLPIPAGFKLNAESSLPYAVDASKPGLIAADFPASGKRVDPPAKQFTLRLPLAAPPKPGDSADLTLSVAAFVCSEGSNLCTIKSYVWTIPVTFAAGGAAKLTVGP